VQLNDTYRHKGLRRQLIDEIKAKGIKDENVLAAMLALPRHFFLDSAFEEWAYMDKAFPIGNEQTISQPYTVAYMTHKLDVQKGDSILEIGTGSGYQAALLALLGATVYTIERQEDLYKRTKKLLKELNFNSIRCFFRDGTNGLPEYAPFHKIIVTAGTPSVPEALRQQLAIGGVMIIPVGKDNVQYMQKITRHDLNHFETKEMDTFKFVPFLKGVNKHK
jgi:protein-L-isoaspartate(D-aspartate) O-methyltransferase